LVGSSSEFDPYRSKVAEEMLCEVIVQHRSQTHEGAMQGLREARQLPTDRFDIQAYMFKVILRMQTWYG
jgi:hypothetical protein